MRFSFVFPTRDRVKLLARTVTSILDTAANPDNIEFIIAYDNDDPQTTKTLWEHFPKFIKHKNLRRIMFKRKNEFAAYYNDCIPYITGDVVWAWGDDNIIVTEKWDKIIKAHAHGLFPWSKRYEDDVWLGATSDYRVEGNNLMAERHPLTKEIFPCFPILSHKAVKALKYIHNPGLRVHGNDVYLYMLFKNVERVIDMRKIEIITEKTPDDKQEERLKIHQEDLQRMVDAGIAKKEGNTVAYNIANDAKKLRLAIGIPKFYRLAKGE